MKAIKATRKICNCNADLFIKRHKEYLTPLATAYNAIFRTDLLTAYEEIEKVRRPLITWQCSKCSRSLTIRARIKKDHPWHEFAKLLTLHGYDTKTYKPLAQQQMQLPLLDVETIKHIRSAYTMLLAVLPQWLRGTPACQLTLSVLRNLIASASGENVMDVQNAAEGRALLIMQQVRNHNAAKLS